MIQIFCGNYGSGKSELALNFALAAHKKGLKTCLLDMDLINPYFRSSAVPLPPEIKVISPVYSNTASEAMSISPEVFSAFNGEFDYVAVDAGGDPVGSATLGLISDYLGGADIFFVHNPFRPMQDTLERTLLMLSDIERRTGINVAQIISNPNLALFTTIENVTWGLAQTELFSTATNKPIYALTVMRKLKEQLPPMDIEIIPIDVYMDTSKVLT